MRMYADLASWYPLLTPLGDYAEEGPMFRDLFLGALGPGRHRLLELGCGAGHNAWYLRDAFDLTLTDLSPAMVELARVTCPDAEHHVGDMRTLRLGRTFDAVFAHDAIVYLLTEADLAAAFATARAHLRPGGVLIAAPDAVTETFAPGKEAGGSDGDGRSLRYLEWTWQREGQTDRAVTDYVLVTREGEALPEVHIDRHEEGLFPTATWVRLLVDAGFDVEVVEREEDGVDLRVFVARAT